MKQDNINIFAIVNQVQTIQRVNTLRLEPEKRSEPLS